MSGLNDPEEDQREAMQDITSVLPLIDSVLTHAVATCYGDGYSNKVRAEHDSRAAASCISSHADKDMMSFSDTIPGLERKNCNKLIHYNYKGKASIRLKKADSNGRSSSYPTKQQKNYDDQIELPGLPPKCRRLVAGCPLGPTGTKLERIMIARPLGKEIFWTAEILKNKDAIIWQDISPRRLKGTGKSDFDGEKVRKRRGSKRF